MDWWVPFSECADGSCPADCSTSPDACADAMPPRARLPEFLSVFAAWSPQHRAEITVAIMNELDAIRSRAIADSTMLTSWNSGQQFASDRACALDSVRKLRGAAELIIPRSKLTGAALAAEILAAFAWMRGDVTLLTGRCVRAALSGSPRL